MLYPLLHRLERLGHIRAEWGSSPEGRRRKNYQITDSGHAQLAEQQRQWRTATRALGALWETGTRSGPGTMKLAGA